MLTGFETSELQQAISQSIKMKHLIIVMDSKVFTEVGVILYGMNPFNENTIAKYTGTGHWEVFTSTEKIVNSKWEKLCENFQYEM